jgi:hypothetical protein
MELQGQLVESTLIVERWSGQTQTKFELDQISTQTKSKPGGGSARAGRREHTHRGALGGARGGVGGGGGARMGRGGPIQATCPTAVGQL